MSHGDGDDAAKWRRFGERGHRSTHSVGGVPFYVRGSTSAYPTVDSRSGVLEVMRSDDGDGFGDQVSIYLSSQSLSGWYYGKHIPPANPRLVSRFRLPIRGW